MEGSGNAWNNQPIVDAQPLMDENAHHSDSDDFHDANYDSEHES